MMIPYAYNPALHDLYLYEDFTFTHSGGTSLVKRPYAFNPDSPLYGYRYSLEGIMACYRTFSTCVNPFEGGWPAWALAANDLTLEVNKPAKCNSWPPTFVVVNPKIAWGCYHTYGFTMVDGINRDTSLFFNSLFAAGTYLNMVQSFRWIKGDDTIVDLAHTDFYHPYTHDNLGVRNEANAISFPLISDALILENVGLFSVNPMAIVDPASIPTGADIWCLDGSMKIIAMKKVVSGLPSSNTIGTPQIKLFGLSPTYAQYRVYVSMDVPEQCAYLHDSGSTFYVEVSPPTSNVAGDGVLGIIPGVLTYAAQIISNDYGDSVPENLTYGAVSLASISPLGDSVPFNYWQSYWQGRGINLTFHKARRGSGNLASQTVAQQIQDLFP